MGARIHVCHGPRVFGKKQQEKHLKLCMPTSLQRLIVTFCINSFATKTVARIN